MRELPNALRALAEFPQFILYKLIPSKKVAGKMDKLPVDHRTLQVFVKGQDWQKDPAAWTTIENAIAMASMCGDNYGVGYFFTPTDPFFFVDLDGCLLPDGQTWSATAVDIMSRLPGAAIEVSQSGRGLHIFGKGTAPDHACKNIALGLELYTEGRFVALTGTNAVGDAGTDCSVHLTSLVNTYFSPSAGVTDLGWTSEPVAEWTPLTDEEILSKAMATKSAGSIFESKAGFKQLWEGDEDALALSYPDTEGSRSYDGSSADAALAQHLAFWTGKNCEHIQDLMRESGLVRDKWEREDYLHRTITRAVSLQEQVYSLKEADTTVADQYGAAKLRGSDAQISYAENIRALKLAQCGTDVDMCKRLAKLTSAKFWIDSENRTAQEIDTISKPIESAAVPLSSVSPVPVVVTGYQFLGATQQMEYFKGCVYVQSTHRILTPNGSMLKSEQFNATYGGYVFQLDEKDKTTRKAFEALTESQMVRYPIAEDVCFKPNAEPGAIILHEGRAMVNTYYPVQTRSIEGDITPFTTHLAKLLPDERDRDILLAYMAACVQYKGTKFQWAPLLQGAEGNGKTLLTRCVAFAIGEKYTHFPPANELAEKFNSWLFDKLFIGVEDVYVPDHKKEVIEVLKPMITNDRLGKRAMQADQVTQSVCANFMLNSNHKDAIRKTKTDRRFAVFYTAQQDDKDLARDGMGGDYFPKLYKWLKEDGYAIVTHYLSTYAIPAEFDPAGDCHRAPETSSTHEAISASQGGVEQEIMEAIAEGRPGFANGWVSSVALERLLNDMRATRMVPRNKRSEILAELGYVKHPALHDGRVNNAIPMDEGKKSRLFIKDGHVNMNITSAAEVARVYQEDQVGTQVSTGKAGEVFAS